MEIDTNRYIDIRAINGGIFSGDYCIRWNFPSFRGEVHLLAAMETGCTGKSH